MPARAMRWAGRPVTGSPRSNTSPEVGANVPAMTLNSVVLPAPLGPMTPVILPRWTSKETSSRAVSPEKVLVTPRRRSSGVASVVGSDMLHLRVAGLLPTSGACDVHAVGDRAVDALRQEDDDGDQQPAEDHQRDAGTALQE